MKIKMRNGRKNEKLVSAYFSISFYSKCYPIELKFFEHLPKMKLKGEQKKTECFSVILFPAMGIFPIGT